MWRMSVLVLVACHSDAKPAAPVAATGSGSAAPAVAATTPADAIPCEDAAKHGLAISKIEGDAKPWLELLIRHCKVDQWSPEYRRCVLTSNNFDEGRVCEGMLTQAQLASMRADIEAHGAKMSPPYPKQ